MPTNTGIQWSRHFNYGLRFLVEFWYRDSIRPLQDIGTDLGFCFTPQPNLQLSHPALHVFFFPPFVQVVAAGKDSGAGDFFQRSRRVRLKVGMRQLNGF